MARTAGNRNKTRYGKVAEWVSVLAGCNMGWWRPCIIWFVRDSLLFPVFISHLCPLQASSRHCLRGFQGSRTKQLCLEPPFRAVHQHKLSDKCVTRLQMSNFLTLNRPLTWDIALTESSCFHLQICQSKILRRRKSISSEIAAL